MQIGIRHETRYDYAEAASGAIMRLRLQPPTNDAQTVLNWTVSVNDMAIERWIVSGYGDPEALWRSSGKLSEIRIVAEGEVMTTDTAGITQRGPASARPLVFLRNTPLTGPSDALAALAESVRSATGPLDSMHGLCAAIYGTIQYRPGSTSFATTAAEALEQGSGVCQDQSHVFIAAARLLGIPARYVTGYLRDPDRPDGEHDPHAWTEGWVEDLGWVAFDSSLGHSPIEGHIRLTVGLDAADASPIRALISQGGEAVLSSDVQIAALPLDPSAQAQAQQ